MCAEVERGVGGLAGGVSASGMSYRHRFGNLRNGMKFPDKVVSKLLLSRR